MPLYHYSDDPHIEQFAPRTPKHRPEIEPFVWAIDEWHQPLYWTPRDCPRVSFWPLPTSTAADLHRFWSYVPARMVIAIEVAWYERLCTTTLYRYTLPEETFIKRPGDMGHVSRATVIPLSVEPWDSLPQRMFAANVELRICQSLVPLGDAIIQASLHFSLIRMRNAEGWIDPKDR